MLVSSFDRELHIAPGVGEQLGKLGLHRRGAHDFDAEPLEEQARLLEGVVRRGADELRQAADLLQRMTLGDALWAENDFGIDAGRTEPPLHRLGRAREHG